MDRLRQTAGAVLVLLVLCGSASAQGPGLALPGKKLVIGCVAPLANRPAPSTAIRNAIRMAAADAKVEVTVVCEDSKGTKAGAAAAMKAVVAKGPIGVIGDFTSSATAGALEVADMEKVPLISPSSSSAALTKAGDYFFRTVPNDKAQAAAAADMVAASDAKSVAVLSDGTLYGKGLAEDFTSALKKKGGKSVTLDYKSAADAKAAVAAVEKSGADAVFFAMNDVAAAAAFIKAAASMKWMLFAGDSIMDPDLYKALGANADMLVGGMRGTGFSLGSSAFRTSYGTFTNSADLLPVASHAYDATTLLLKAYAAAAPPKKGPQVAAAILKTKFAGAGGDIALDATGDVVATKDTYSVFKFDSKGQLVA